MSVWSRGTFSALALRRSVAHIPFIQTEAHWFERSRSNKWQPIESCDSKERRVILTSLGFVVSQIVSLSQKDCIFSVPLFVCTSFFCLYVYVFPFFIIFIINENIHTNNRLKFIRETYPHHV